MNGIQPGDIVEWTSQRKRERLLHAADEAREEGGRVLNTTVYKQIDIDANAWECQQCKEAWCLEDGSPKENRMNYCPFCGVKIEGEIFAEDDAEMFPTNCDWCGALIRCDGEDFFIEPPEVNEPVVVCESCYKVHCEKHEKEQTFGSVLEES